MTIKDLRHAFATHQLADGVSPAAVADQLGHANPATTLRFYADSIKGIQGDAVDHHGAALDAEFEQNVARKLSKDASA